MTLCCTVLCRAFLLLGSRERPTTALSAAKSLYVRHLLATPALRKPRFCVYFPPGECTTGREKCVQPPMWGRSSVLSLVSRNVPAIHKNGTLVIA